MGGRLCSIEVFGSSQLSRKVVLKKLAKNVFLSVILIIGFETIALPVNALDTAVLQGLNKVTARILRIYAPVNQSVSFGTLQVVVRSCSKAPPEEPPESAAFIEITEKQLSDTPKRVFSGWMFSSTPALSAMEHPVYDVWVVDCIKKESSASSKTGQNLPFLFNALERSSL